MPMLNLLLIFSAYFNFYYCGGVVRMLEKLYFKSTKVEKTLIDKGFLRATSKKVGRRPLPPGSCGTFTTFCWGNVLFKNPLIRRKN